MRGLSIVVALTLLVGACTDRSIPTSTDSTDGTTDAQIRRSAASFVDVIVVLDQSFAPGGHAANQASAGNIARGLGLSPTLTYGTAIFGFAASVPEGRLNALRNDPRVNYVELDGIASIPTPRASAPSWCTDPTQHPACANMDSGEEDPEAQTTPWGVTRVGGPVSGAGKTAWIIDTGIDFNAADLNVDVGRSVNFVTRGKDSPNDGNGHGTHVAGTVAAIDNSIDVVGVAAGATVVAVRVLSNSGSGLYSWVTAGVDHVAANAGAGDVANMSLGGPHNQALHDALLSAAGSGVKFSLAAGNDGDDANNHEPAHVNHNNVYTISAIASDDCMPSWSNYGNPPVDFAAPGVSVLSTAAGGGTSTKSGTSMAAPHVAGILLIKTPVGNGAACNDPAGPADAIAHF